MWEHYSSERETSFKRGKVVCFCSYCKRLFILVEHGESLLEVAGLLLVLAPLTHLQVSPSLKQLRGFHPGIQAQRLTESGGIPLNMSFSN